MEEYHVVGDPKDDITVDRNGNIYVPFGESSESAEMKKRQVCDFFANINPAFTNPICCRMRPPS